LYRNKNNNSELNIKNYYEKELIEKYLRYFKKDLNEKR